MAAIAGFMHLIQLNTIRSAHDRQHLNCGFRFDDALVRRLGSGISEMIRSKNVYKVREA